MAAIGGHEHRTTLAWLGAALERQKKMPELRKLLGRERPMKDPAALAATILRIGKQAKANG